MNAKQTYDKMAKVAVIGDSSVGKTNILLRYVSADYQQSHVATIGIDFKVKTINLNNFKIKLQIWDTAGQQRFRNLTGTIYQGAEAVVLTYAIDNRQSFESISKWMDDVKNYAKKEVVIVLIGNKVDKQSQRQIKRVEGELLAKKIGALFFQTSAKDNINIQETFKAVAVQIYNKIAEDKDKTKFPPKEQQKNQKVQKMEKVEEKKKNQANKNQNEDNKHSLVLTKDATKKQKKGCC